MTYASYNRQHLALYAAGYISGDGNTSIGIGAGITRVGTGVYAVVFGADDGLVDDQSFTIANVKSAVGTSGSPKALITVEDTSNLIKTLFVQGLTSLAAGTLILQNINADLEIKVFRSVIDATS